MADYLVTDTELTSIADAIRTKGGTTADLEFPQEFIQAINDIQTGGGGYSIEQIIARSDITGDIVDNTTTDLAVGALSNTNITSYSSSSVSNNQQGYAFYNCKALKTVSLPELVSTANNALGYMFYGCSSLQSIYIPKFKRSASNIFQNCTSLEMIVLPSVDYQLSGYFANGCTSLTVADIGKNIGTTLSLGNSFSSTGLKKLILRRTAGVVGLNNINNFRSSPFASNGTGGTLYVPSALISSYQSATNWSTILGYANNSIQAIEGSQYENYYADGTPIE